VGDVKFIRKNGRIIPIRAKNGAGKSVAIKEKSYTGTKTVKMDAGDRFSKGFSKWGKIGAGVGAVTGAAIGGAIGHAEKGLKGVVAGAALGGAYAAVTGGLNWGLVGGGLTAAFGKRNGQIKIRKKKMTSRGY